MDPSAPRLDCTGAAPAIGYHRFHDDLSLNFQCNRWVQWIGSSAIAEVTELAARCDTYPEWIDGFLGLAESARQADRRLASAYYDRAANLVRARSVTTRTFTAAEQASNHCQVGNIGAAIRVIQGWLELSAMSREAEKVYATGEFARQS